MVEFKPEVRIPIDEDSKRALRCYLELVRLRARQAGMSVLEVIESDLRCATNGQIGQLFTSTKPEGGVSKPDVYSFSTPYGDLIYHPQRRIAVSPLLPEGTLVYLTPLEGLFLEIFMRDPNAVYTQDALTALLRGSLSQEPVLGESNRAQSIISRLRRKLGEEVSGRGTRRYDAHRLIVTTPAGYSLVSTWKESCLESSENFLLNRSG